MGSKIICGDALEILPTFLEGSVDLIFADPPYNIGKAAWDKIDNYLEWSAAWIKAAARVLKPNGAFWISHSKPLVLTKLSEMVSDTGYGLINWVTWDKYNGLSPGVQYTFNRTKIGNPHGKRSFDADAEYLIYHADEGDWTVQCDRERGFIFEPLRAYLDGERKRAGIDKADCNAACGFSRSAGGMASRHYFSQSQWRLPTQEHYKSLQCLFNANGSEYLRCEHEYLRRKYEYLRREYEDLRREYENLRYTFNNPGKVSSVWQFPPAKPNGHPTPKPEALLERIIAATSNENDLVLDPFVGSGTTCVVAKRLGRHYLGIELNPEYVEIAETRLKHWTKNPQLHL